MDKPRRKAKHMRIYRAVRNFLINELGIDKEMIRAMIFERIEKSIKEIVNQTSGKKFEKIITDEIATAVTNAEKYPSNLGYWNRKSIESLVESEIQKQVSEMLQTKLSVSISKKPLRAKKASKGRVVRPARVKRV